MQKQMALQLAYATLHARIAPTQYLIYLKKTQMALQLAYATLHARIAPTYESCSTKGFFHGRTEVRERVRERTEESARAQANERTK